jgi:hypothetical protein
MIIISFHLNKTMFQDKKSVFVKTKQKYTSKEIEF